MVGPRTEWMKIRVWKLVMVFSLPPLTPGEALKEEDEEEGKKSATVS